jgi:hypothetical protein
MAVTDLYVARYLLDSTQAKREPLPWQPAEGGGYAAEIHGVRLGLFHSHSMGWSGLCLSFTRGDDVTYIEEPRITGIFGRTYENEDERQLAEALRELWQAVSRQHHDRKTRAWRLRQSIREALYQQVLFGKP